MQHQIRLFEVVAVYRLSPIPVPQSPPVRFRIEILRAMGDGRFHARVYRDEAYRLQPTFPMQQGQPVGEAVDEVVSVEDLDDWSSMQFSTRQQALDFVMRRMRETFTQQEFEPL